MVSGGVAAALLYPRDERLEFPHTASSEGAINIVIFPEVIGQESGTATVNVTGSICDLALEFLWGRSAYDF